MDNTKASGGAEANKHQQHLSLLKEEYVKLQTAYNELEWKYAVACAANEGSENSFVAKLVKTVASLYDSSLYSDMKIKIGDREVPAHKFVFATRSKTWNVRSLADVECLDWSHMDKSAGLALLSWIYTDQIDFVHGDDFTLALMRCANSFELEDLVAKCEKALMASVNENNCIRFYTTADEIGAETLKEHCSSLISAHWDDFTSEDFAHMTAPLLYEMIKSKSEYPLHSAVRLRREDVVFLYLVENNAQLSTRLNALDCKGELPLDLALRDRQTSIAQTLLDHGADPDARDNQGWTLLHRAVERGDGYAAHFLLEHSASVSIATPERGDTALHLISTCSPETTPEETVSAMTSVAKRLLDRGLDPNLQNKQGFTALHLAVMARNEEIFDLLLTRSDTQHVKLNLMTSEGHTPLWFALISSRLYNRNSFAARLLEKGAESNPIYPQTSNSLLHLVAEEGLEDAGLFLCSYSENINHINKKGESALHIACSKGLARLVTRLLECGANPNLQTLPPDDIALGEDKNTPVYRQTPLHTAILSRNDAVVKAILDYKVANLNLKDSQGNSPLCVALSTGMQHLIADLIEGGADVNFRNGKGLTPLHQAILNYDIETAIFLLNLNANMDANMAVAILRGRLVDKLVTEESLFAGAGFDACVVSGGDMCLMKTLENVTPLQLAITCKLGPVVEALCRRGVDMSLMDDDNPCPLWVALDSGQEDIASILVRHGVDTDCWSDGPDGCFQTLLHKAIDENNEAVARFLIQSGCDLNTPRRPGPGGRGGEEAKDEQTPLHLCCQWGLESVVQTLVEHGASINAQDAEGKTPLHIAIQNQHPAIISLLLCHPYLDLSVRDKSGLTPFATALACRNNKAAQAIRDKLPTAAEQFDNKGRNFMHMAIQKRDVESVLFLLSINVDVNSRVQDPSQTTPLHLAALTGNEMLVRSLLLAGARPNDRDSNRRTALHAAAEAGHTSVVSALIQNGADYDAVDIEGNNALHFAVREGHLPVVRALLTESRVNAEAVNNMGWTPLHVLAKYARDNAATICELFIECMPDYALDKPDNEGSTALLLAYMKGNGSLCRALVKAGACVGAMNKQFVTIFNYHVATKTLLTRLLDSLSQEPPWVDGDWCLECGTKFGLTMRKHHCRHCGRLLCSKCSSQEVPILKFNLNKPVRVCSVCFSVLQVGCT